MLERQEELEHPLVVDPETNVVHRITTPLTSPSPTNINSSLASHITINVDEIVNGPVHPG